MREQAINQIEWLLKDLKTFPEEHAEWGANKTEGAIDFAHSLGLITDEEYREYFKKLLNLKLDKIK